MLIRTKLYGLIKQTCVASLLGVTSMMLMGMGERYASEGAALWREMNKVLIEEGVCVDIQDCRKKVEIFGEHGDRVHLHIYGFRDWGVIAAVFSMVVQKGLEVTSGVPISIAVYPKPKSEYLGWKSFSKEPQLKLEINQ